MNIFGYKFVGFSAPCNDVMLSIISLFMEIFFLGALIMFIISFLLLYIYDCFSIKNERNTIFNIGFSNSSSLFFSGSLMFYLEIHNFLMNNKSPFFRNFNSLFETFFIDSYNYLRIEWVSYSFFKSLISYFPSSSLIMNNDYFYEVIYKLSIEDDIIDVSNFNVPIYFTSEEESFLDSLFLIMPTIVILFILIPTLGFLYNTDLDIEQLSPAFGIDVIGHQWYWTYEYSLGLLGKEIVFDSIYSSTMSVDTSYRVDWLTDFSGNTSFDVDRHLLIPTNTNILLTLTSTDVIHSWAVPKLGIKIDAVPGKLSNTMLFTYVSGYFFGQCSELCGVFHGFMPICVEAIPSELFFSWCMIYYYSETSFYYKSILIV